MTFYRLSLTEDDNDTFLVTSSDFPELATFGDTRDEAVANGENAVLEAIAARIVEGRSLPSPHIVTRPGAPLARISYSVQLKVGLANAMHEMGKTRADLARLLNWHREQVDRLFRLDHASRTDQMEAAFTALGYEVRLGFSKKLEPTA